MKVYLVRHGEALPSNIDPERGLSPTGSMEVRLVAEELKNKISSPPLAIYHSSKKRAVQTAGIMADVCAPGVTPEERDALLPDDDPHIWIERIDKTEKDIMLVGHMPYMGIIAGALLSKSSGGRSVEFSTATVACLEGGGKSFELCWVLRPS
ncbi:MAG: phosphohistidine phosphatase SixA [Deltaproteobacteria bacterium]|nr:phosphohistidine phosphatase SixA [Deltaproteobacteria bacterium]